MPIPFFGTCVEFESNPLRYAVFGPTLRRFEMPFVMSLRSVRVPCGHPHVVGLFRRQRLGWIGSSRVDCENPCPALIAGQTRGGETSPRDVERFSRFTSVTTPAPAVFLGERLPSWIA